MGVAHYGIVPVGNYGASSRTEDQREYSTKESAFESATAAASMAIHQGHEVHISVPCGEESETTSKAF
jgi:hypothetical protein